MRKIVIAVAAILFIGAFAACSSDSKKTTTTPAGNNTGSSSSSSTSGDARSALGSAEFCQELSDAFDAVSNQSDLSGAKEALAGFKNVDPPAELEGQWDDFLKAMEEYSNIGENDTNAQAQVAVRHAQSLGQVGLYISSSCAALGQSQLSELSDSSSS